MDLLGGLPFTDGSAEAIAAYHVLEHMHRYEAENLLHDAFLVLEPGGTLRIVVPDVELLFRAYATNDTELYSSWCETRDCSDEFADQPLRAILLHAGGEESSPDDPAWGEDAPWRGKCNCFMGALGTSGLEKHRLGFDFNVLRQLLEGVGFVDVRRHTEGESRLAGLGELDADSAVSLRRVLQGASKGQHYSLFVEASRPGA